METKICKHCGRELPVEMFGISNKAKDGLQSWCKACQSEYDRERTIKKREELEERRKAAQEVADQNPEADLIVTKDGRVLRRVSENCKPLEEYNSRDLLAELKRRGYVWTDMWMKTKIDYAKI